MVLNRVGGRPAADWLFQAQCEKLSLFFMCGDMVLLSGGNPYKALQFIS